MYTEINAAIQAAKVLYEVAKANKGLANYNELASAISEVNAKLIDANAAALASQEKQYSLSARVRELESRISDLDNWNKEIQKYHLHQFPSGCFAFELQPNTEQTEPVHYLCESCACKKQRSILQPDGFHNGQNLFLRCHVCKLLIPISPMSPALERFLKARMKG